MMGQPPPAPRRFPPPWRAEETPSGWRVVTADGLVVAYVYARDDMQGYSTAWAYLTSDEARRIARGIARLPELLGTQGKE